MRAQGFVRDSSGLFTIPENGEIQNRLPSRLIPRCPADDSDFEPHLRSDNNFLEDEAWKAASENYYHFVTEHQNQPILFLELGVGHNTPVIIKYAFWQLARELPKSIYACINYGQAYAPKEIEKKAILIDGDIGEKLEKIKQKQIG